MKTGPVCLASSQVRILSDVGLLAKLLIDCPPYWCVVSVPLIYVGTFKEFKIGRQRFYTSDSKPFKIL